MNNQLGKPTKWDYIIGLLFALFILNELIFKIDFWNKFNKDDIALYGIIVVIILWIIDYAFKEISKIRLKETLIIELKRNLKIINEDIFLIKRLLDKGIRINKLFYIEDRVFNCMINTGKITDFPQKFIDSLFNFYSGADTLNTAIGSIKPLDRIVDAKEDNGKSAALLNLDMIKGHLEQIFIQLDLESYFKEHKQDKIKPEPI